MLIEDTFLTFRYRHGLVVRHKDGLEIIRQQEWGSSDIEKGREKKTEAMNLLQKIQHLFSESIGEPCVSAVVLRDEMV